MRRLLASISGLAGALAVVRLITRRRAATATPPAPQPSGDPRAAELRRRLEESRAVVGEQEDFASGEVTVDEAEPVGDPGERRRRVHAEGRAAAEAMRRSDAERADD